MIRKTALLTAALAALSGEPPTKPRKRKSKGGMRTATRRPWNAKENERRRKQMARDKRDRAE